MREQNNCFFFCSNYFPFLNPDLIEFLGFQIWILQNEIQKKTSFHLLDNVIQ